MPPSSSTAKPRRPRFGEVGVAEKYQSVTVGFPLQSIGPSTPVSPTPMVKAKPCLIGRAKSGEAKPARRAEPPTVRRTLLPHVPA